MRHYRLVSSHPEDLSGGQQVAPGAFFDGDEKDDIIKRLVQEGKAVKVADRKDDRKGNS